jgi:hypothetical protein
VRGLAAPLLLVVARTRRRPVRWLLPALGIALAAAFALSVAAEGVVAGDRSSGSVLARLSPLDRSVRVTWQGVVTPAVARQARGLLRGLGLYAQTEVTLLNPVRLGGIVVRPAGIEPPERWLSGPAANQLGFCHAQSCPMLLAGGGRVPSILAATGVRIRVVGSAPLSSAVPLGFSPLREGAQPVLVTGDVAGLEGLPGLSGVFRTHSWVAPLPYAGLHSWQLGAVERRLAQSQAVLLASGSQFSMSGAFDGLDEARAQASAAPRRLLLAGGGAITALAMFIVLAGAGLRRDQLAELERLRNAGARTGQRVLFVAVESGWLCAVALSVGAGLGIMIAALLARAAGEPIGGVLAHSVITPVGAISLAAGWLAATSLITLSVLARSARVIDALALAAAAALGLGLILNTGGDGALAVLLAPLCCVTAGVLTFRAAAALLRAGDRLARRGPMLTRLAFVGLARAPALPALAIAFIAVSVGLGGFALAYRATLIRGVADQSADKVPLDAIISPGPDFNTPLELAPLARWRALADGTVLPVRRTDANYTSGAGTVSVPALGVPASALARIHGWRASDGSAPLNTLARRLVPPGPARSPGPVLPVGARWLSLTAVSPALDVAVTADLRDAGGAIRQLALGIAGAHPSLLRARVPLGRWELAALELDEPTGLEITNGHQNGENPAAATQFQARVAIGPVQALSSTGRPLATTDVGGWRAVGAAADMVRHRGDAGSVVSFATTGMPGIVRPRQPGDTRPVPVVADPQTAAAAGPGQRLALTVDGLPVMARVVGILRRFPTLDADNAGFVVADEATLSSALDAQLPGQGRADELWVSTSRPGRVRAALRTGSLVQLSSSFRADVAHGLRSAPVATGVLGTAIAAAALSAALSVLGLLTALLGGARDERIERDLEAQGIGPRALRAEVRMRLALASVLGVWSGLAIAVLLTRLAVASVRAAGATPNPQPPLVTVVPWVELAASGIGAIAVLALAGRLATWAVIRSHRASTTAPASVSEAGGLLSESVAP